MIEPLQKLDDERKAEITNAQARKTALLVAAVLLLIAAWNYHRGRMTVVAVLGGIGFLLLLTGLFIPPLARRFHYAWMRLAVALGYVNSRVLLGLMFYGVFTPYNLLARLFGRDPLDRRKPGRDSYWIKRKTTRQKREQFERLF
ncbi:MAG TPA: SxtJ family membrane protein [Pyrinomonadaceae bacterium]|nr:SxtJ family membrane protein [Pyrinomonadaceae bacterium]